MPSGFSQFSRLISLIKSFGERLRPNLLSIPTSSRRSSTSLNPDVQVFCICLPLGDKFWLTLFGQDGTPVYGGYVVDRNNARLALHHSAILGACMHHYNNQFYLTDLTNLTVDELRQHTDLMSSIGIIADGPSE